MDEYTTYELCRYLRNLIVIRAADVMNYTNWSDDFAVKYMRDLIEKLRALPYFTPVQPAELTTEQMDDLGFGCWTSDSPTRLIPLWLYPFLADEVLLGNVVNGKPGVLKKAEMDTDQRGGCLAYGVLPIDKVFEEMTIEEKKS